MLFHPTSHLPRNSHSFTDWHFSLSGVVFHYVLKLYRSVYSSWMYIFSVSCFCSCYHLDFPLCRTFDFSHVIVKSCQIYFSENPHSKPAPITQTHTTVPLPCICIFCKRWMCEKQRLYGGRERRMRVLCEFSAAGFSVSSRLIIQEGVVGFVMVIYLSVGFTLLIVGSRVKCHKRTIMGNVFMWCCCHFVFTLFYNVNILAFFFCCMGMYWKAYNEK